MSMLNLKRSGGRGPRARQFALWLAAGLFLNAGFAGEQPARNPQTAPPIVVHPPDLSAPTGPAAPTNPAAPPVHPDQSTWTNTAPARDYRTPSEAEMLKSLDVKELGPFTFRLGRVEFDKKLRAVTIPASVRISTQVVEYVLVTESGKAYESLLTTDAKAADVHLAFLLLGMTPTEAAGAYNQAALVPPANAVSIEILVGTNNPPKAYSLPEMLLLRDERADAPPPRPMPSGPWLYNGSLFDDLGFVAGREGSIISLIRDAACLMNNPRDDRDNHHIHLPNPKLWPAEGSPVRVVIHLPEPVAAPARAEKAPAALPATAR